MIFLNQRRCPVHFSESSLVVHKTRLVPDLQKTNLNKVSKMLSDRMDEILKTKSHFAGVVTLNKMYAPSCSYGKKVFLGQCVSCDVVITLLGYYRKLASKLGTVPWGLELTGRGGKICFHPPVLMNTFKSKKNKHNFAKCCNVWLRSKSGHIKKRERTFIDITVLMR